MLYAIVGLLAIIADQWVKYWTMTHIPMTSPGESVIPGILSLAHVHNDGAAFGFLSGNGARIPFIVLAGAFTLVVIIALATNIISGRFARWCIVMVAAGGLSNCLDRVLYGYVVDMFKFDFINFPVFNLADVFITVFGILFALAVIFGKTRRDDDIDEDFLADDEEERISRAARKKEKKSRKDKQANRRKRDEDYDDYEEEDEEEDEIDEEPAPRRKKKEKKQKQPRRRRNRAEEEEDDVEEEVVELPKPRKAAASAPEEEDPFAAWDRASAASASASRPAPRKAASSDPIAPAEPTRRISSASAKAKPSSKPAAKTEASERPAPTAKPTYRPVTEEEFSLDDILNEFR